MANVSGDELWRILANILTDKNSKLEGPEEHITEKCLKHNANNIIF